ncbi:MAG: endonuclease IV [Ruminococcaceae bacterium]|nr:endonuclease IV [Oscillospiraceae bacterium]
MSALFGPAGNAEAFYEAGFKSTHQAPAWLHSLGLTAYEYQCGRGVRLSEAAAEQIRLAAAEHGIAVSLHAPYFISLASKEPEKRDNSVRYILDSAQAVLRLGGDRIVVHPGGLGGLSREDATALACETLHKAQQILDREGFGTVHICPETMGKINQLGTFEEILTMCAVDERFLPCVDFGHLNSRTHGEVNSREAFAALLDRMQEALGEERARVFHAHFSKIEYTAGGEKRHLTFADTQYGPDPAPLMELIAQRALAPVIICESDGTQAHDAVTMHTLYKVAKGD